MSLGAVRRIGWSETRGVLVAAWVVACAFGVARAQPVARSSAGDAPSGYELSLAGPHQLLAGRVARFRGIAYRVHGLAELRALPGASLRARCVAETTDATTPWAPGRADARGFFELDVPVADVLRGNATLSVAVGEGESLRTLDFPVSVREAFVIELFTDRQLYEPGERVHVWARLFDARSMRPIGGREIRFDVSGEGTRSVTTSDAGVASFALGLPEQAIEGARTVVARIGSHVVMREVAVGTRRYARLFASVRTSPDTAAPHAPVSIEVTVTTPSGAPVRGAVADVVLDGEQRAQATTDAAGRATVAMHAPAYLTHDTGIVVATATVRHPAHGATTASALLRLAVPHSLTVEAVAENAGLVPEVPGRVYVRLADGAGEPPPAGTEIEVTGPAVMSGRARATTDAHGIAVVPTRLPLGAAVSDENGQSTATIVVRVGGAAPRTARVRVPVLREAEVVPRVERPVVAPGAELRVAVARSPFAPRSPVVVELVGDDVVAARVIDARADHAELTVPERRLGVLVVRARPLRTAGSAEGIGASDAVLVRPADAAFPEIAPERDRYAVGDTARLTLRSGARGGRRWAAILVRDLAAHERERAFSSWFLGGAIDRALLDPERPAAETLLRTALAAYTSADGAPETAPPLTDDFGRRTDARLGSTTSPERGVLRDPIPLSDELRRRGVGEVMRRVESMLASALDEGALDELTVGRGANRRFRADLIEQMDDAPETLGGGGLSLAMLESADPSFGYASVARRVARGRLVKLLVALARYLDPGQDAPLEQRVAAREPSARWLARLVERGLVPAEALIDPWGGRFALRRVARPALAVAPEAAGLELVSPGPDGRVGTADDVRDPFARAVPRGTPYAVLSGEDELMHALAHLAPGADVLRRLVEAYARVAAEVTEDEIGDAVRGRVSEGLYGDTVGTSYGYGGLGLTGTGRGGGGSGVGTIGLGSIGTIGRGSGTGYGMPGFARVVRERFPATLVFRPEIAVDASGTTSIDVALGDAVTTYLVEAIVWGDDGWTWSASTRVRVERDVVVDAPVPEWASVGDVLELPVRVGNRTAAPLVLGVELEPPAGLGPARSIMRGIDVGAGDARELPVTLAWSRVGRGHVLVGVRGPTGAPLDAVRRPIEVRPVLRRARLSASALVEGASARHGAARSRTATAESRTSTVVLEVPEGAIPTAVGEVRVRSGLALLGEPADPWMRAWVEAWSPPASELSVPRGPAHQPPELARAIAASWQRSSASDAHVSNAIVRLTRLVAQSSPDTLARDAEVLLALAPAVRSAGRRPVAVRRELGGLVRTLRDRVASGISARGDGDDTTLLAMAAAGLAWTASGAADLPRVRDLVRRIDRRRLRVGDDAWIATDGDETMAASALAAMVDVRLGRRPRAFELLRTMLRVTEEPGALGERERAWARVAAMLLVPPGAHATHVRVAIDEGPFARVAVRGGVATLAAPSLSRAGRHVVRVDAGGGAPSFVDLSCEIGLEWAVAPARPGPITVAVGDVAGVRDARSVTELVVRNRSARTVAVPVLEVSLPAGAELDEEARASLRPISAREPESTRGTLTLVLRPMPPGATARVPLAPTWSVAGRVIGFGVASYAADRPDDVSIVRPRVITVRAPGRP
ncbi:MAG: hypothetical protein IT379_08225 [Deltaproteobacteria bacterium]|nr:hypothetical protein [Deltaproteobacteria bacterium]